MNIMLELIDNDDTQVIDPKKMRQLQATISLYILGIPYFDITTLLT